MGYGLLNYCGDLQMGAVVLIVQSPPVGITPQLKTRVQSRPVTAVVCRAAWHPVVERVTSVTPRQGSPADAPNWSYPFSSSLQNFTE